jgi:hypothetical protein
VIVSGLSSHFNNFCEFNIIDVTHACRISVMCFRSCVKPFSIIAFLKTTSIAHISDRIKIKQVVILRIIRIEFHIESGAVHADDWDHAILVGRNHWVKPRTLL